jgi:hypothetical protein
VRRSVISGLSAALIISFAAVGGAVTASAAPAVGPTAPTLATGVADGTYVSLTPSRLLDSRTSPLWRPLNSGETYSVKVTGRGGVPSSGVSAVVLNLTVTQPTSAGWLTAYPKGAALPNASSINFAARETRANLVTVPVSSDGYVSIRNATGKTHVIADVQGYYVGSTTTKPAGAVDYFPDNPWRLLDTRTAQDGPAFGAGEVVPLSVSYKSDVAGQPDITPDISALAINVTAVRPQASGFITAWNGDQNVPNTSNLNFAAGKTTSNMVLLPVAHSTAQDGTPLIDFALGNGSNGTVDVLVDVVGYYKTGDGLRYHSIGAPKRIVDTRSNLGTTPVGPGATRTVTSPSTVANANTFALVTNVTAVRPTVGTYLTLWDDGSPRPTVSNLNPANGQVLANMAMIPLSESAKAFDIYNAAGTTNVLVDVAGRFDLSPNLVTPPAPISAQNSPRLVTALNR